MRVNIQPKRPLDQLDELILWLRDFEQARGRPLRVLHLGNIAGNAFLNAKFLRSVGVDADVVCHDYDHVMAMPEWEELKLNHFHGDDFNPVFHREDVAGYKRPHWFISGALSVCVLKVSARRAPGGTGIWQRMCISATVALEKVAKRIGGSFVGNAVVLAVTRPRTFLMKSISFVLKRSRLGLTTRPRLGSVSSEQRSRWYERLFAPHQATWAWMHELRILFLLRFHDRPDQLDFNDLLPYGATRPDYERMFSKYDIVQCYATEPIHALVTGKKPYIAFEHGTLRAFTMENNPLHRLTALAYREADHTFITNGDCLAYAQRLGLERYSPIIHPVDVDLHRANYSQGVERIKSEIEADVLIFCPVRHDYEIKGTDRAVRALPLIKERVDGRVVMILSNWGAQVDESRKLVEELDCCDNVVWRASMSRIAMIEYMLASDIVFDQFVLPVFGSTAPQAIAAGRPVLASYVPEETAWLIPEAAPIVSAFTPEEIAQRTIECLDPDWKKDYQVRARRWIDKYHSPRNVLLEHLQVYRDVLARRSLENVVQPDATGAH